MNYSKKPTKLFLKKLSKYSKTNQQLYKEIIESLNIISEDPFQKQNKQLKSKKCPKCKKTRMGNYRIIYFINESRKEIEIIDIGLRKNIYKKWD